MNGEERSAPPCHREPRGSLPRAAQAVNRARPKGRVAKQAWLRAFHPCRLARTEAPNSSIERPSGDRGEVGVRCRSTYSQEELAQGELQDPEQLCDEVAVNQGRRPGLFAFISANARHDTSEQSAV